MSSQKIVSIVSSLKKELNNYAEPKFKEGSFHYFKEQINPIGVRLPNVRIVSKTGIKLIGKTAKDKALAFEVAELLFKEGYFECDILAIYILESFRKTLTKQDFILLRKWLDKYCTNWAFCDGFSAHLLGSCIANDKALVNELFNFQKSKNRWMVRASIVSLVPFGSKSLFYNEIIGLTKPLLKHPDDLINKAVGWLLREVTKGKDRDKVLAYIRKNAPTMSRTTLRYSIEKLSEPERKKMLAIR